MADDKNLELQIRARNLTAQAFESVSKALKALEEQSDQTTTKGTTSWGKWFATIGGGVAVGNLLSSAFRTVGGLLADIPAQLEAIGQRGSDVADVRAAFDRLTASVGETSAVMLGTLRSAFGGAVSDFNLMQSANEALRRGVQLTAGDFGTLVQGARILADQVGGSAKDAFDRMLSAISRGNARELKDLGVNLVNIERSTKAYAASLGVEESALTQSHKQIALRNAVLKESKRLLIENGEGKNDFADNVAAAKVQLANLSDQLSEAIARSPALNTALDFIARGMSQAFGADQTERIQRFATLVGQVAILVAKSAESVIGFGAALASAYTRFFASVNKLFLLYSEAEQRQVEQMLKRYQDAAERGEGSFNIRIAQLQSRLDYLKGYNTQLTDEANGWLATNAAITSGAKAIQTFLADMAREMEQAEKRGLSARASVVAFGTGARGAADDVSLLSKQTEQFQKHLREMIADADRAAKNDALEAWAMANAAAIEKMAIQAATFGKNISGNLLKAFLTTQLAEANQAAAKLADQYGKEQIEIAERVQKRKNDLLLEGMTAAEKILAEGSVAALHGAAREVEIARQKTAAQLKAIEPIRTQMPEIYAAARAAIEHQYDQMVNDAQQAATRVKGHFATALQDLPKTILAALQGGGNVGKAIGGSLLGGLASDFAPQIAQLVSKALGSGIGGAIGSILPGIGTLLGSAAGGFLGDLFGKLFGPTDYEKRVRKAAADLKALKEGALSAAGGMEQLRQQWELVGMGMSFEEAWRIKDAEALRGLLDDMAHKTGILDAAMEEYGFTWEDLGEKARQSKLTELADTLFEKTLILRDAGIDYSEILRRQAKDYSELLQSAIRTGTAIPLALRPVLEELLAMGELVDENGDKLTDLSKVTWAETLSQGIDRIVESVDRLYDALTGLPRRVDVDVNVTERRNRKTDPDSEDSGGVPAYAFGTPNYDYARFSRQGTAAMLHGDEAVIPRAGVGQLAQDIAAALAGSSARSATADRPFVIHQTIEMDGRVVTRRVVQGVARNEEGARGLLKGYLED